MIHPVILTDQESRMGLFARLCGGAERQGLTTEIALTTLRVFTGLTLAFEHGIYKMPPSEGFVSAVGGMGFPGPELFAWLAGISEFVGGLFLAAGLLTRPASLVVLPTMFTAAFIKNGDSFGDMEKALFVFVIALVFLLIGSGRYSLDGLIRKGRH